MQRIFATMRGGPANIFGGRATETSTPPLAGDMKRGNLYAEQGKIGDERWSGALKVSGMLLES